jgi:hypothetical protein
MYADYQQRIGGINLQFATALQRIGLQWQNYSGSFEDTIKLIQDVKNSEKFKSYSDIEQLSILKQLGLSGNWRYLFEKEDFNLDAILAVTQEDIEKEIELSESMEKLRNSIDQLKQKVVSKLIEGGLLTKMDRLIDKLDLYIKTPGEAKKDVEKASNKAKAEIISRTPFTMPLLMGAAMIGAVANSINNPASIGKTADVISNSHVVNQTDKIVIDNNLNIKTSEGVVVEDDYTKWLNESTKPIEFNNSINRNGKY